MRWVSTSGRGGNPRAPYPLRRAPIPWFRVYREGNQLEEHAAGVLIAIDWENIRRGARMFQVSLSQKLLRGEVSEWRR